MHTLRKLAREIHRRSVWQILSAYFALSWGVLSMIELMSVRIGLPLWTPDMALALLLIGLPVMIATAVVQGGIPWLRIEDAVDPNELEGRTPAEVHVVPESHPLHGTSILTWRNAILGGVMAGALLVTSVVAYLTMWGLGIGPVGSLLAQGILDPNDRVLIVALDAGTTRPDLVELASRELEGSLRRSTVVIVVSPTDLTVADAGTPGEAGTAREAGATATVGYALDLATQAGIRVVISGNVEPADGGYVVSGRITLADGQQVAQYREYAADEQDVPAAAALVAVRIRAKIGESLRAIRTQ